MKSKQRTYELNTISEILDVVNDKNLENFITDLKSFLKWRIELRRKSFLGDYFKPKDDVFRWEDDGKHDVKIEVDVKINNDNNKPRN